jgi:ketosteroid isomerase-like protein
LHHYIDLDGHLWSSRRATDGRASMSSTTGRHRRDEADRREFQALLEGWAEAIVANDADRIDAVTEPDWELVTPESGSVPLDRFLDVVRSGHLRHSEMTFEVLSVRRHGDLAVVVAHGTNRGEWNGELFSADEWVTEYFIQRDGHWRCALSSLTPNDANPAAAP